jgi:hypothetical protein
MKLALLALVALATPNLATAATLTYRIDFSHSKIDEDTAFALCGLPKEISLDDREDLPTVVIRRTLAPVARQSEISYIQASSGGISGGDLREPYMGDYRVRVALLKLNSLGYRGGVYQRVEVVTYGSKQAPKAFTVDVELLNYRESAELAEGSVCTGYAYRLI